MKMITNTAFYQRNVIDKIRGETARLEFDWSWKGLLFCIDWIVRGIPFRMKDRRIFKKCKYIVIDEGRFHLGCLIFGYLYEDQAMYGDGEVNNYKCSISGRHIEVLRFFNHGG